MHWRLTIASKDRQSKAKTIFKHKQSGRKRRPKNKEADETGSLRTCDSKRHTKKEETRNQKMEGPNKKKVLMAAPLCEKDQRDREEWGDKGRQMLSDPLVTQESEPQCKIILTKPGEYFFFLSQSSREFNHVNFH